MKVLIFENSKQITERLICLISETILNVTFYKAGSYAEAIYFYNECNPDAVILDIHYPDNNGVKLLERIKAANDKTIVIALSSHGDDYNLQRWEQSGAHYMLDKFAEFEKIPMIIDGVRANMN